MDLTFKKSNLLILKGVFPRDFSALDTIYMTSSPQKQSNEILGVNGISVATVYTRIPTKFTDVTSWIRTSNLKCWECDERFTTYPKFVPLNPEKDKDGNDVCDVQGNFCEWNCVVGYIMDKYPPEQQWDILELTCIIESKFTGRRRRKIMRSPEKTEMKQYCGEEGITSKQYREKIEQLNINYDISQFQLDCFRSGE